ncbi:MAG TPA: hypothetical protein VMM60_10990 [Ilumatobacter sp.]|nr:hypothetical protein [Ilumatobacter sp.]
MARIRNCFTPILLGSVLLLGAACGGDDDAGQSVVDVVADTPATDTESTETTEATEPTEPTEPTGSESTDGESTESSVAGTVASGADLFDSDFAQVCRGTGQAAATPYEQVAGVHPLVMLSADDGVEFTGSFSTTLPDGWSVLYPDLASAELVLCQSVVSSSPTELCTGYTDDENPDAGELSVQLFDATYEVSVRVATTAEVLATETVEASDDSCPMFVFFSADDPDPKPWNSSIGDGVVELLVKPFVNPS